MEKELYQKIFARMDELNAIRKDLTFGCLIDTFRGPMRYASVHFTMEGNYVSVEEGYDIPFGEADVEILTIIGHPLVLSDCIMAYKMSVMSASDKDILELVNMWNGKPCLNDQSDELGEKLLSLIS